MTFDKLIVQQSLTSAGDGFTMYDLILNKEGMLSTESDYVNCPDGMVCPRPCPRTPHLTHIFGIVYRYMAILL